MGRRAYQADPASRRQVEAMAGYGIAECDIACVLEIDPKTLRKHYWARARQRHVKATAKVAENLSRRAIGEGREAVTAAILWLKTRGGWRESPQGLRIPHCGVTRLTDQDLERAILGELILPGYER